MRRMLVIAVAAVAALAVAGGAQAGCWATAGIEPLPTDVRAGETWAVTVTVLQHGEKPLAGATPTVILTNGATGARSATTARPTETKGEYAANVSFPSSGTWRVAVNDGFPWEQCAQTHTFGSYTIASAGGGPGGGVPWWPFALGAGLVAAAGAAFLFARLRPDRRRAAAS